MDSDKIKVITEKIVKILDYEKIDELFDLALEITGGKEVFIREIAEEDREQILNCFKAAGYDFLLHAFSLNFTSLTSLEHIQEAVFFSTVIKKLFSGGREDLEVDMNTKMNEIFSQLPRGVGRG